MAGAQSEAERLRHCRTLFERASNAGISMAAARELLARERWEQTQNRQTISCGTRDMGPAEAGEQRPKPWMMAE